MKRNVRSITALGETRTVTEWADISGVPRTLIYARLKNGMSVKDTLFTPVSIRSKKRPRFKRINNPLEKMLMDLIAKERTRTYRYVGMWYKIFLLENNSATMKAA